MTQVDWTPPGPGPWSQDRAHLPVSVTALIQEVYPDAFSRGFSETVAPWGLLLDDNQLRFVNGFPYTQPVMFDAPGPEGPKRPEDLGAEIERRAAVAAQAFVDKPWRAVLERWDREIKPAAVAKHQALAGVDLGALDPEGLRTHLHACVEHLGEMWYQHHRFNSMAMLPVGDFVLHASAWSGRDPVPMFAVFDGYSPVSGVVPPELAAAVTALRSDVEAQALLHGDDAATQRMADLRARVPAVDDYMRASEYRLSAGFDLTNPTIGERPDVVLDRIRAALGFEGHDTERADALAAEIRADVPDEHHAAYDELLGEARLVYRLRDERGLYSDAAAVGILRLALIELGRRLADAGRIAFMYDTLDITAAEIDQLLDGDASPTADELSARVARRKELSAAGAPKTLGPPAPEPPPMDTLPPPIARVMSALGFYIQGLMGDVETPIGDSDVVIGIGASPGEVEGRARIVRNFDELFELQEGEVLVTPATGESFNAFLHLVAAIVTDHGSFASHAAIMGREMGVPAVVGTVDASSRIPNGARVRVDGKAGTVVVLSTELPEDAPQG